jgi:hypothetical protein
MFAHWPAISIDRGGTVYLVWDPDARQAGTSGGCSGESPAPNSIQMIYTRDLGQTWSKPITVTAPKDTRVFWPWVAAGDAGKVSVVWYQEGPGQVADNDCQAADIYVYEATTLNATAAKPAFQVVNASGRSIHSGQVCQGGTTCVATGQDRRLGDYFTNALDTKGCVFIATGDTKILDPTTGAPLPTARPLFIRQNRGPALYGKNSCG